MHTHDPLLTPPPDEHRWALRSVEDFLPTLTVRGAAGGGRPSPSGSADLAPVPVRDSSRGDTTVGDVLDATDTEAWLVLHEGVLVDEQYRQGMAPGTSHMLMSVTKSVVGIVTGILCEQGRLVAGRRADPPRPGARQPAAIAAPPSGTCSTCARASGSPRTTWTRQPTCAGWRRRSAGDPAWWACLPDSTASCASCRRNGRTAEPFDYRSCETDVLGWVCERAAGASMADLISTLVWQPIGAERDAVLLCDGFGAGVHDGGLAADRARRRQVRSAAPRRRHRRRGPGRPAQVAGGHLVGQRRRPAGLRGLARGGGPARWLVPQPVLGRSRAARRPPALPRDLRAARSGSIRRPVP